MSVNRFQSEIEIKVLEESIEISTILRILFISFSYSDPQVIFVKPKLVSTFNSFYYSSSNKLTLLGSGHNVQRRIIENCEIMKPGRRWTITSNVPTSLGIGGLDVECGPSRVSP